MDNYKDAQIKRRRTKDLQRLYWLQEAGWCGQKEIVETDLHSGDHIIVDFSRNFHWILFHSRGLIIIFNINLYNLIMEKKEFPGQGKTIA
jgi:hypothetical protein